MDWLSKSSPVPTRETGLIKPDAAPRPPPAVKPAAANGEKVEAGRAPGEGNDCDDGKPGDAAAAVEIGAGIALGAAGSG